MFSKAALLFPMMVSGFKYDELQQGHCPFKAGEIDTIQMDPQILEGVWINVFDRKKLNEHVKCYSARWHGFNPFEEDSFEDGEYVKAKPVYYEYSSLSTEVPKTLSELDEQYLTVRMGASVNFSFEPSGSIGFMEHSAINPSGDRKAQQIYSNPKDYSPFLWDSQYLRYMQVLETDADNNYIVLYKCMETAVYTDKKDGTEIKHQEAWKRTTRESMDFSKRPIVEFKGDGTMTVQPMHFQNIKILWRAKETNLDSMTEETVAYPNDPETGPTEKKINELKYKIFKKLPEQFPMEVLTKEYGWLDHPDEKCHYNPFNLEEKKYVLESYGHREDVKPMDGFFSRDIDYTGRSDDL